MTVLKINKNKVQVTFGTSAMCTEWKMEFVSNSLSLFYCRLVR